MYELKPPEVPTLAQALHDYIETRPLRAATAKAYRSLLWRGVNDWMDLRIDAITRDMVIVRHRELSYAPTQANYVMRVLRAVMSFAVEYYEDADGKPILVSNPVKKLTRVKGWNREKTRLKEHIPAEHIGKVWHAIQGASNETMRDYLSCLLLTGLRMQELGSLPWSGVDLSAGFITIDGSRTKNNKEHKFPISTYVAYILRQRRQRARTPFVFPSRYGTGHLTSPYAAVEQIVDETGVFFRPHSFRRTFSNLCTHPSVAADESQVKTLLNHAASDGTYKHYLSVHPQALRNVTQRVSDLVLYLAAIEPVRSDQELSRIARRK